MSSRVTGPGNGAQFPWLVAVMLIVWVCAYLPWLGVLDLQFEEPRRVLVARAMLDSGEYWVPQLAGEPYTAKPPLFNWTIAASAALLGGLDEFSARLPSVLCTLALALVFVAGIRRQFAPGTVAFVGAALLLAPEILAKGRIAEIEPLFGLLVATAIGSWYLLYAKGVSGARLWVAPLVLTALAYLTKREPGVVFFYLAVGPFLLLRRQWRLLLQPGHFVAIGLAALVVSGWLVGTAAATSWGELWDTLRREVLERGVAGQGVGDVLAHVAVYPLGLWTGMLPFSALLPLYVSRPLRTRVRERFGDLFLFCVVAVLANLPIYWFRGDVAIRYFLPMFPFMLLLAAMIYEVLAAEWAAIAPGVRRYLRVVYWTTFAVAALALVVLAASPFLPRFVEGFVPLLPTGATLTLAAAGVFCLIALARRAGDSEKTLLLVFCTAVLAVRSVYFNVVLADRIVRYDDDRNAPAIVAEIERLAGSQPIYASAGVPLAVWYYGQDLALRPLPAVNAMPAPGSWLLVDASQPPVGAALEDRARFVYKDQELLLARAR